MLLDKTVLKALSGMKENLWDCFIALSYYLSKENLNFLCYILIVNSTYIETIHWKFTMHTEILVMGWEYGWGTEIYLIPQICWRCQLKSQCTVTKAGGKKLAQIFSCTRSMQIPPIFSCKIKIWTGITGSNLDNQV